MEEKIDEIKKILNNIIDKIDEKIIPKMQQEHISYKTNKDSISFYAYGNIILKIVNQKESYFEIREILEQDINKLVGIEKTSLKEINEQNVKNKFEKTKLRVGNINYIQCYFKDISDINKIEEEIKEIYYYLFLSAPVESFGCCSRYIECSDAKKCVNPDKKMAQGCQYKENLKNGRIFYGKNKNI